MNLLKKLKKLNSRGFSHHFLLPVLVVVAIGGIGAYVLTQSHAATVSYVKVTTAEGCALAGRKYVSGACQAAAVGSSAPCADSTATYRTLTGASGAVHGYCGKSGSPSIASSISQTSCVNTYHRQYVYDMGCARRIDQRNVNKAIQCQPDFPNYVAIDAADKCVADSIVAPTSTTAAYDDPISNTRCRLLGRTVATTNPDTCNRACTTNAGVLVHGTGTNYYCNDAVLASYDKAACDNHRRVWLDDGCARRFNRDDIANAAQCSSAADANGVTYRYYNANWTNQGKTPNVNTSIDVCEKDAATALANEKAGVLGAAAANAKAACDAAHNTWDKTKSACNTPTPTPGGNTNNNSGSGPLCLKNNSDGTQTGTYAPAGQQCPAGTTSLCANNAAPVGSTCPNGGPSIPTDVTVDDGDGDVTAPVCKNGAQEVEANDDGSCPTGSSASCPQNFTLKDGECESNSTPVGHNCPVNSAWSASKNSCVCTQNSQAPTGTPAKCPEPTGTPAAGPNDPVSIDKNLKEKECTKLYGRAWEQFAFEGRTVVGCSVDTCSNAKIKTLVAVRKGVTAPYCKGYAQQIEKAQCMKLHREWMAKAQACAMYPKQDVNKAYKNTIQCEFNNTTGKHSKYNVYIVRTGKIDECVTASTLQNIQHLMSQFKVPFSAVANQGPEAFCKTVKKGGYHWVASTNECRKDRPPVSSTSTGKDDLTVTKDTDCAPMGITVKAGAKCPLATEGPCTDKLNRKYTNGKCQTDCKTTNSRTTSYVPASGTYGGHGVYSYCKAKTVTYNPTPDQPTLDGAKCGIDGAYARDHISACAAALSADMIVTSTGAGGDYVHRSTGSKVNVSYGNHVYIRSGSWHICDDERLWSDTCKDLPSGHTDLCALVRSKGSGRVATKYWCSVSDAYIKHR